MSEIEMLVAQKKWKQAQALLQRELLTSPTDHWVWLTLSLTYYEQKQYEQALACSKRAVQLQPDCPLALWHYAGALSMTGREEAAVAIWTVLLDMDIEQVAHGDCGEGMDWALRLINDVQYRLGRYFQRHGKTDLACAAFEKYVHNRAQGVESTYDQRPVKAYLAKTRLATS